MDDSNEIFLYTMKVFCKIIKNMAARLFNMIILYVSGETTFFMRETRTFLNFNE